MVIPRRPVRVRGFSSSILCLGVFLAWAWLGRPFELPDAKGAVAGFAFSPIRAANRPQTRRLPRVAEIDRDLALLSAHTSSIRTYTVEGSLRAIPRLAESRGMQVTLGAWLSGEEKRDIEELHRLFQSVHGRVSVERAVIGNETLLHERLSIEQLIAYLDLARAALPVPVSTAEPWHVWMRHPELVAHVDVITVHLLPFWEGVPLDRAFHYLWQRFEELRAAYPGTPIVIGETGWPSRGRSWGDAQASALGQAEYVRRFVSEANRRGVPYFLIEAFDQPWKRAVEGEVGAYWGAFDAGRRAKLSLRGPMTRVPKWPLWGALSSVLALVFFSLLRRDSQGLRRTGEWAYALCSAVLTVGFVWVLRDQAAQYWMLGALAVALLLGFLGVVLVIVMLVELHEWVEARFRTASRGRSPLPASVGAAAAMPMVSVHLPIHDEPPELVSETILALDALDHGDLEIIVVDNNTEDDGKWKPVEALCASLGDHVKFVHVEGLVGFKAGALNLALERTHPDAKIVAVVDSDYEVDPSWLKDTVGHFANPNVAIVQAPQDYRDGHASAFKHACVHEYGTFFKAGMVTRNERNAIIQHGTMTLVRRDALEQVGRWATWTVTEDAELGLRILAAGLESIYVPKRYGRGLSPDTFIDYKSQRFRWVYGAVQILRAHTSALFLGRESRLTRAQRYHFIAGWLPWIFDGLGLSLAFGAVIWSALVFLFPTRFDVPAAVYTLPPMLLFVFRLAKSFDLQRVRGSVSWLACAGGVVAGLGLTWTVGVAVWSGFFTRALPFVRTPKLAARSSLAVALSSIRGEAFLGLSLLLSAILMSPKSPEGHFEVALWRVLLSVLAIPHLSAVAMAVLSASPLGFSRHRQSSPAAAR